MRASRVHAACSPHPRRPRLCRRPRGHEAAEAVSALALWAPCLRPSRPCPLLWPFPRAPGACTPRRPRRCTRNMAPHATAAQNPARSCTRKSPAPGPRFWGLERSDSPRPPAVCLLTLRGKSPCSMLSGEGVTPGAPEQPLRDGAPRGGGDVLGSVAADMVPPGLEGPPPPRKTPTSRADAHHGPGVHALLDDRWTWRRILGNCSGVLGNHKLRVHRKGCP